MSGKLKSALIRPCRDAMVYGLLRSLFISVRILPRKLTLKWHGVLARFVFNYFKKTRKTILQQLDMIYGKEKSPQEIYRMGQDVFVNLGKTFTDYAFFAGLTSRKQFLRYFKIEGEDNLQQAYEKGKGVLCLIPHTSGWEFSAILPPILGYETSAVSREIKNHRLNTCMVRLREKRGMKNISRKKDTYEKLVEVLLKGECLIIMIDQDSKKIRGKFLKFFGLNAYTPLGCARLAIDTGAAIVPMATFRNADDTYTFKILPEIPLEITGDTDYDLQRNTQIHNDVIESLIRQYPEQWVWMHKRWDTTPENLCAYWERRKPQ
ncbi:MAG: Lipid A biosynthesis palmitoleoyltransferase [Candidatus Ordinivivax streblomastigis]|uniref:Lipid A biosynthesis palmitoleoyltransferase n=1 Tax=Candidatus Ordinivivax streblomastigis TaxID=2540710 RepID=A0A5M8NZC8_9BACT|nr:MAG: Lipid A biosynthesis palmitoleoyltransferase [Candidatus Ordinivivax streblomastigis]